MTEAHANKTPGRIAYEGWAQGLPGCKWDNQTATQKHAWECAAAALAAPGGEREAPKITQDGPHKVERSGQRWWLAYQLLDSNLSDAEAYGIVRHHPVFDLTSPPEPVAWRWSRDLSKLPQAVTLLFIDPLDEDGCQQVRFGLSTDAMNAEGWSYLPEEVPAPPKPVARESGTDDLHKVIVRLREHISTIQAAKRDVDRNKAAAEFNPMLAAINDLPNIVRNLENAEFLIEGDFERYEDALPPEPVAWRPDRAEVAAILKPLIDAVAANSTFTEEERGQYLNRKVSEVLALTAPFSKGGA